MNNINLSSKDGRNIKKDKIIVRSLSIVCLVGGCQVATQYFAHQFNYQQRQDVIAECGIMPHVIC